MKVRLLSGLCFLIMLAACDGNNLLHNRPSDVLDSDMMISLLVDIHLTDASLKLNQPSQQSTQISKYYSSKFAPVFKKHKTTAAVFINSMKWYSRNIADLEEVYTEVITRLSTLESEIRITVKPNRSGTGVYNPFYPEVDTTYLPDTLKVLQIPFALPFIKPEADRIIVK